MKLKVENFLLRLFYGPSQRYQHVGTGNSTDHKVGNVHIISLQKLAILTILLPFCGFAFCVIWSLKYNFTESTSTHCNVSNYLPSISASIGAFSPQKFVWRFTVALHSAPRYLVFIVYYYAIHSSRLLRDLNIVENTALLGLTVVSSTEFFPIHAFCFMTFIICSFLGMIIHLMQQNLWSHLKRNIFCVNTFAWMLALYFYWRHNLYCETGMYTLFALGEYIFVLSNMLFHFQAYYDFAGSNFVFTDKLISGTKFNV